MITADALYDRLSHISLGGHVCRYSRELCEQYTPIINDINTLKKEKNALILAHSYVAPEIIYGVADHVGDSFELSKAAQSAKVDTIIFAAVKFMAETAKILNPSKRVYTPSFVNGCSLADSITADTVRDLKKQYPEYAFICYINTSADVKALCDCCVTSSNVYRIIENHPNDHIYFLPDQLMGKNIQAYLNERGCNKSFLYYHGTCYVHEEYDPDMITYIQQTHPDAAIVAHPECKPSITEKATFVGSTSQMINYVKDTDHSQYVMLTECGLTSRLQMERPDKQFIGSCTMCKYMKSNRLSQIKSLLTDPDPALEIQLDTTVITQAHHSLKEMFRYAN
ncbi:MAG: quinolinate synthase NadA [Candidatus Marinamargulisbacteria bacterium]